MEGSTINVKVRQANEIISIISISGFININTTYTLNKILEELNEKYKTKNFIFEVENVKFISSIGIGIFMNLLKKTRHRKGKIIFVGMKNNFKETYEMLRLDKFFFRATNLKQALIITNS